MKKELTGEQIAQLFEFTRKHYVEFYDVQVELVDHLASSIETDLELNTASNFDIALSNVFGSFGIFGFGDVIEQKAKAVWRNQWKLWFKIFKSQFKFPALLSGICIWLSLFTLLSFFNSYGVCLLASVSLFILSLSYLINEHYLLKRTMNKKLILINQRYTYISFSYLPLYLMQFSGNWIASQNQLLIASIFTLLGLLILSYRSTSKIVFNEARELYPEAFKDYAVS
ncbi:MAG: hypothetical protein H7098_03315 [Oligoflexus sp.]|nr:hypothetical protein [Pseudopedobacter sp.]